MNNTPPRPNELWKHFKGSYYLVTCVGRLLVTNNEDHQLVDYQPLWPDDGRRFARTLEDFTTTVSRDSYEGPRFVNVRKVHGESHCHLCDSCMPCPDAEAIKRHDMITFRYSSFDTVMMMKQPDFQI